MIHQDLDMRALLGAVLAEAPEPPTAATILENAEQIVPSVTLIARRGGAGRVLIAASAAAALIGGLVAITMKRDNNTPPSAAKAGTPSSTFSPPGTEVQLAVTVATTPTDANGIVKPDSSVHVTVAGQFDVSWYTTVAMYEGHAIQMDCDINGSCSPYVNTPGPHTGLVTDASGKDFWSWVGVPSDATYVVYTDGDTVQWQRPASGIAAFPATAGHKASVIAIDETGRTVATADLQTGNSLDLPPFDWSRYRDLTAEQQDQMHLVINDAMTSCLQAPDRSWSSCVDHADQALVQWFDDRANERRASNGTTP